MKRVVSKVTFSKICSVVTAVCFLASTIGSNLYASITPLTVSSCDDIFNSMSVIKQEYGKVTAVQDSSSDITVVNIQDLHCHEQTQRNISEIIKTLDKNYSLKSVFIEGGYGQIDVSWINKVQDEKIRNSMIEKMLQSGYLTGAEYYAVKSSKYDLLKGIEEKDIHQANLDRLSKIIEKQPQYISVASKVNKEIEVLGNIHLNEKNKRFSRKISDYRKGKTDTLKFYRLLSKYVEKINSFPEQYNNIIAINLGDYPNFSKYIDISQQSKDTNPRQVSIELQTLINIIKNKIPYSSYKKLLDITNNFSNTEKLVEFLTKFSDMYDIDLSKDFKELNNFFIANRLNQNLNPIELVNEERKLIEQIRMALSYDNTEYEISYISDFSMYFEDYLTYSLTSTDWKYIKQDFEKFRLLYSKYATVDRINEIASDINFINEYYDTNDSRNDIFVSNILRNENPQQNLNVLRTSDEILKQSREVFVVITGGYHSEALKSIFADRKVNDIVITPNVTGNIKNANKRYDSIIKEQKSIQSNALAFRLASCLSDENQKNLMAKVALDILGKDKLEQIKALVGQDIDISKIENIEVDEQKKSEVMSLMQTAVNSLVAVLPSQAGQNLFNPDIDNILTEMSLELYDMGFYFENGSVYEIDSSEYKGKDLIGIPAEVYSRMFAGLQNAMLKAEQIRTGTSSKNKKVKWGNFPDKAFVFVQEVLFRAFPAFFIVLNPVIGIPLFVVSQIVSLSLEIFIQWKSYQKLDVKNPDFLKKYVNKLSLITILLTAPYVVALAVNIIYLPVALVLTIVIHYLFVKKFSVNKTFNNKSVSPFLLAPSMGIFWRAKGITEHYRTALKNRNDKKADSERYRSKTDVSYETILRDRNNSASLENIITNEQLDVKYRLFALMYFKTNNLDVYNGITENIIDKEITEKIKRDFKESIQKNKIKNNFDLRANLTGIFLILDDILHEQLHGNSYRIYEEIQDAVIVRYGMAGAAANDDFIFGAVDYETLAHEIGHRILKYSSMEGDLTLHELFAETISNLIAEEFNIIPVKSSAQLYGLFDPNVNYIRAFQEEHEAADGFLNLIKQSTEGNPNWLALIDTIINYGYYKEGVKRPSAQGAILKDILTGYEEVLKQTGQSNIVDFAKKRTAKYSIVVDILKDIEQKNPYQYENILRKIRSKANIQKPYQQEDYNKIRFWQSKLKFKELFNIIAGKFSSEKLYDFEIIAAIFSSPDKIDSVLNDMFDVIFKDTDYSMYDFENLYRIKLLMAHDRIYDSKEELEQNLKPIIDLITSSRRTEPTKEDFIDLKKNKRYTLKNNFRLTIIENFNKLGLPELIDTLLSPKTVESDTTGTKLSIFDVLKNKNGVFSFLAKTAPVWEEIVFRTIPSIITIFNPVLGISLFAVSQIAFLFSHTIVKWLVYRDSAGNKQKFSSVLKHDIKSLSLPILLFSIPYILFTANPGLLLLITVNMVALHFLYNRENKENPLNILKGEYNLSAFFELAETMRSAQFIDQDGIAKLKMFDQNLLKRMLQGGVTDGFNIISRMKYLNPLVINSMESDEYLQEVFQTNPSILRYIQNFNTNINKFNLFFILKGKTNINNNNLLKMLINVIYSSQLKLKFADLDDGSISILVMILNMYEFRQAISDINYVDFLESFNNFFKLKEEFDFTVSPSKIELFKIGIEKGFESNLAEMICFSEEESVLILEFIKKNNNQMSLLNFRLYSQLKNILEIKTNEDINFLIKYCFAKDNIVEQGRFKDNMIKEGSLFIVNIMELLKNPDRNKLPMEDLINAGFNNKNIDISYDNIFSLMLEYADSINGSKNLKDKLSLLDQNLIVAVVSGSQNMQEIIKDIVDKIKYTDPLSINKMTSVAATEFFETEDSLLQYISLKGITPYQLNLFFTVKNKISIKDEKVLKFFLEEFVLTYNKMLNQNNIKFNSKDIALLVNILNLYGKAYAFGTVKYLFNKLIENKNKDLKNKKHSEVHNLESLFMSFVKGDFDKFEFNQFFKLTKKFHIEQDENKLELLQISFENGFKDNFEEIMGFEFSQNEILRIIDRLYENRNNLKTDIENFRLFVQLKDRVSFGQDDFEQESLVKYCFGKGNIVEQGKFETYMLDSVPFITALEMGGGNVDVDIISTALWADFTVLNIRLNLQMSDAVANLVSGLSKIGIDKFPVENDLVLKIFFSQGLTDNFTNEQYEMFNLETHNDDMSFEDFFDSFEDNRDMVQRYRRSLAISALIDKLFKDKKELLTSENFDTLVEIVTKGYFSILKRSYYTKLADKDTKVTIICNNESFVDFKKNKTFKRFSPAIFKKLLSKIGVNEDNIEVLQRSEDENVKTKMLDKIKNTRSDTGKSLFLFEGHGKKDKFFIAKGETISADEFAEALYEAWLRGQDLKEMTFVFNSCYSADLKDRIIQNLESKDVKNIPVFITIAGYGELGYAEHSSEDDSYESLLNLAILKLFDESANLDLVNNNLLLGDFILVQNDMRKSNPTISIPLTEDIKNIMQEVVTKVNDVVNDQDNKIEISNISSSFELSVFSPLQKKSKVFAFLAKTAPVWEEIVFRAIPSLITVFNPVLGISLFAVSQIAFLFSHTIVKWIVSRDSAGNRLAFSGLLKDDLKNLTFPSLVLLIPYILTMFISPVFLPIATLSAIIIHSLNNKLSIFGSYNDVQLKNQFELKLPFEELGVKPGDKVLITYIGDGSLLFSRNIKEINALFELLSAQQPEKRRIYELQIYPNTFEFTVKKGGIVNIKQLADSLGRKKQNIEGENGVKLFYRIEPLQEPDEEKTKESDLQPNEDKKERQTESDENRFASEAIISDELIKKLEPSKVIELDFSKFIDFEGENDNSEAINSYIREIIANNDLRNAFITLTFSKLYGTNLDENKIKTVNRILSVLSDEIDGIFTDKIGNVAGVSFFEDILENAFVHGNNLSLNKKIFIYFGNDRDVIVINSNTPQNKTIESLAFASKLNLYGFGSGIKSAEKVSNARYSVTDIVMPDKTKIELYVAYITFRKYQQLKRTLLDKALKKINTSAIWQTTETKNIERQYAYAEIPVLEEGESVFATNFVKGGAEYSGDWVEFKISKKNGAYVIYDVSKRENKFKWYMPYEAQIPLEEKLEVVEENGKFYIRSNYTGIRVLKTQADQGLEKEIDPSVSPQKTEPSEQDNVLSQQEAPTGNYEFERLFRLVHRDSNLKPVIGDSKSYEYRLQLQKLCYALADKLDLDEIEELYRDNEEKLRLAGYLRILKFKRINDNESLQAIVYNNGLDIKYRLMAYMYLRSNGINDFSDRILEIMKENFISGLTSGSFKIDNNFDLSVLGAGILLVLNKYLVQNKYIDQQQEKNLYENISYSTFVDKSELEGTSANSGMFFTSPDPLTMAHEIGHRVLLFYTDSSKGVAYSTIHEIFAGVISAVFAEKAGIGSKYYEDALYELFNTKMQYDYVLQEEHKASRGLFYTVTEIAKQMGKTVKFEILADAVINLIKTKKVLPKRQSDTIKELLTEYMNMLRFKDNYTQEDIVKFEELLREESWKSKVLELFMNLRGASGRNWDYYGTKYKKIMDGMRMHVAETESYRHGILEIDYRDDLVVINNIIMSQPEKINMVLQIVKDELSQSDYLLRPEIAKLIFADLVISLPQMKDLSKYQLDRLIQDIVDKFFSDKVDYKSSEIDYQKIRVYALEEYIFFKIFVPRKFGGKSLANINSITSGKYIERIHDDRHDYSYAESLPPVVPSIDTFFMHLGLVRLYRHIFEVLTKKMVKSKNSLKLSKSMEDYLDIYKIKDNNRALAKVIYNDKLSLKHRLFAFMYLKINGGNVEDPVVINNIKREFAQAIHKNKLQIRNNFDLRAVVTGVYLLLEDFSKEYVSKEKYTETYKSISKAVVLRRGKESVGARANMTFVSVSPLTIAHELGHRILSSSSSTFVDDVTIHELFAYTISNMFKKIVDIDEQEYEYALYSLFNKSANYDEVFQNEHQASKGLISLLKSVSNHIGKDVKWDILADAIIAYVLSSPERVKESNQGTNLRNIFIEYLTQLDAEKHYSRYDLREMFAFAKNVTSGETVLIDILANIKETDRKQYDVILKQMQEKIKPHKSYMKGFLLRMLHSKSKIKEFSDIIKELLGIKPEYRDDTEIINKIIFSQPIQVKNISQIIRAQILRKQEYTKQDFENLIKAEFLFQYNGKYYSKEELDAFMQNVVQNILSIVGNDTFHQHYNTYGYGDYLEAKSYIAQQKARTLQTNKTVEILNGLGNSLYSEKNKAENFRYSVIGIAIGVVLETFSFWMPGFIKQHENPTKTMIVTTWGIRILSAVLAITSGFIFVPIAVPVVLIAVEWITHFVYNLFEIKRMNKNIIVQFEAVDTLNTTGNIADDSVIPVLLLKDIKNADANLLINTGLKVNGETIWQIDVKDSVIFVASDTDIKDLALVLNGSKTLEKRLRKILNLNNINLNVENSVIVDEKTEETYFQNSVAVVNNNKYVQPMINAFKSISFMYSQKTIISLEKVPNNKLYQALINGKARKIITAEQFEYIKQLLQQENKNIEQEILNLRMNGVEIYVKENELTDKYKEYGIIGLLLGGEIYDYYTDEKIEIEIVDSKITLQELESKLINSDKPLLMDIISLQNIFKSTRSIVGAYSGLEALIGNIKIKFGFKNIKARDMENFAHSIDMNDIPDVINDDVNKMFAGDIFNFSDILNLDDGNIISIILNDVNVSEQAKQLFLNTIKERILLKNIQQNREKELNLKYSKYGLKDKKLENLLGKALYLKMQFAGEQSIDLQKDIDNKLNNLTPAELMGKITELSQQAFAGRDPVAIATIIELIMICAEEYRNDDMGSLTKKDLLREYKSMLSAA